MSWAHTFTAGARLEHKLVFHALGGAGFPGVRAGASDPKERCSTHAVREVRRIREVAGGPLDHRVLRVARVGLPREELAGRAPLDQAQGRTRLVRHRRRDLAEVGQVYTAPRGRSERKLESQIWV